jgi:hypothetical protein
VPRVLSQYLVNVYPVLEKQIVVYRKPPRMRSEVQLLGSVDSVCFFLFCSFFFFLLCFSSFFLVFFAVFAECPDISRREDSNGGRGCRDCEECYKGDAGADWRLPRGYVSFFFFFFFSLSFSLSFFLSFSLSFFLSFPFFLSFFYSSFRPNYSHAADAIYYPGQVVSATLAQWKKATWISGKPPNPKNQKNKKKEKEVVVGTVKEIIPGPVEVDWVSGSMSLIYFYLMSLLFILFQKAFLIC